MRFRNNKTMLFVMVVFLILGCNLPRPTSTPPRPTIEVKSTTIVADDSVTFPANKRFQADNGDSTLLFEEETIVRPEVDEMNVHELSPEELNEYTQLAPLPDDTKIISALEITPDGMIFSPPVRVRFDVSESENIETGDELDILLFDQVREEWIPRGKAKVDNDKQFAVGQISHTSIYAVIAKKSFPNPKTDTLTPSRTPTKTVTPSRTPTKMVTPSRTPTKTITPSGTVPPTAEISGSLWGDANGNGSIDIGETTGLGGYTVKLGIGSCNSSGFRQTTSNTSGFYNFTNLTAGTYCVSVDIILACGFYSSPTTSTRYTIVLSNGESASRNFGYDKPIC